MDDAAFRQLLDYLNLSWKGYRKVRKGVKKRIRRHMRALDCRTLPDYLAVLDRDQAVREACDHHMTVSISRFFRDRSLWTALEERLLPELFNHFPRKIRVWSAGCACGEEVYSFAIVWELLKKHREHFPVLELLATDTNENSLARARVGRYPYSSLKEVSEEVRSDFFKSQKGDKQFEIQPLLAQDVLFQSRDLLSDPPPMRFHLILLRNNLLTYYQDDIKIPAFKRIVGGLNKHGLLVIGSHEKAPPGTVDLVVDNQFDYVLRAVA
jgi:chemotaxis protein methyltransferase CheR